MTRPFEVAVAFQTDKSPAAYAALAAQVDRYPFAVVSVYNDLFYQPALGPLLHLSAGLRAARVGPAALNPRLLHPIEIAGQIAVLDAATDGRAYLGLARGTWLDALGLADDRPLRRLRETVELVRYVLARRTDGYAGDLYQVAPGVSLQYSPRRADVPIMLGTWSPRAARLAAQLAVDEVKIGGSAAPAMVRQMRRWLGAAAVGICAGAVTVVSRDRVAARATARQQVAMYVAVVAALDASLDDPEWLAYVQARAAANDLAAVGRALDDDRLDRFAFAGTPEDVVAQVQALRAAGATRIEFGTPHGLTATEGLALLGGEVLPRLGF
jgi:5,10-methylenetetrahydromethanopterin reductase